MIAKRIPKWSQDEPQTIEAKTKPLFAVRLAVVLAALVVTAVGILPQAHGAPSLQKAEAVRSTAQAAPQAAAQAQDRMDIGQLRTRLYAISQMIQTGRLDEAEQGIDILRTEAGRAPLINGMEAFLLYRRHDFPAARILVEGALKSTEPPTWWHVLDAMCMFAMGDETLAKDTLTKTQTEDPRGTGESLISMGAAALHDFTQTPSVEGALTLAFLDRTLGSRRTELNVLDSALKKFPSDTRLIVARLNLLSDAATDPKVVLAETDKAVAQAPDSDTVQATAGALFARMGSFDKALPVLRKAVQLNPKNHAARLDLASALQHEKKNSEALQEFEVVLSGTPPASQDTLVQAYAGAGSVLTDLKRWKEADDSLQKGLALAPESSVLLNNLAWLYATADPPVRDPQKAIEFGTKAATLTRNRQPGILDTLAEAYFAAGNRDKAVEFERRALQLAPGREELKQHLAKYEGAK
jgi:tetratricopeptide (TPR) repeat protein